MPVWLLMFDMFLEFKLMGEVPNIYIKVFKVETSMHDSPKNTPRVIEEDPIFGKKLPKAVPNNELNRSSVDPSTDRRLGAWMHT